MESELLIKDFDMVAEWVKTSFPESIKESYENPIKCKALHHQYFNIHLFISKGEIKLYSGGWSSGEPCYIFSSETHQWSKDTPTQLAFRNLQTFLLEWPEQKKLIIETLEPYEELAHFLEHFNV